MSPGILGFHYQVNIHNYLCFLFSLSFFLNLKDDKASLPLCLTLLNDFAGNSVKYFCFPHSIFAFSV